MFQLRLQLLLTSLERRVIYIIPNPRKHLIFANSEEWNKVFTMRF